MDVRPDLEWSAVTLHYNTKTKERVCGTSTSHICFVECSFAAAKCTGERSRAASFLSRRREEVFLF